MCNTRGDTSCTLSRSRSLDKSESGERKKSPKHHTSAASRASHISKNLPEMFCQFTEATPVPSWCARARPHRAPQSSVAQRAQRRRCDRYTRTPRRLRTRNRSSPLRCFPPWCPARALLHLQRAHTCGSRISLMTERCFRTRAPPTNLPPSRGHERLSVCDELRSHTRRTRDPSSSRHAVG